MSGIPLFTSIPPGMKRLNSQGRDEGTSYQQACLDSWKEHGFDVFSINAKSEVLPSCVVAQANIVRPDRDAFSKVGKSLVFLEDILKIAKEIIGSGPVILTNADIFLSSKTEIRKVIASLGTKEFIVEHRHDFDEFQKLDQGDIFRPGFDFFAFNIEDVQPEFMAGYVFGVPFWDYALPIKAYLTGFKRKKIEEAFAFHLRHSERFNKELVPAFEKLFVDDISRIIETKNEPSDYATQFSAAISHKKNMVRELLERSGISRKKNIEEERMKMITRITIREIDKW